MSFFTNLMKPFNSKESVYKILFQLLIISFPFGSKIFSFSLGILTIYPYLVLLGFLILFSFFFKPEKYGLFNKIALSYFILLFIYGLVLAFFSWEKEYSLFDLRSLFLYTASIYLFFRSEQIMGWKEMKRVLGNLFSILFIAFTFIALFEYLTGIHFSGYFTEEIAKSPVSSITYNTLFIYGNPNNFITYYVLMGSIAIILCDKIKNNFGFSILVIVLIYALSNLNHSRFGVISSCILLLEIIIIHMKSLKTYVIHNLIPILVTAFFILVAFFSNPLFYGPIWEKSDRYIENGILVVQTEEPFQVLDYRSLDTNKNKKEIVAAFKLYRENVNLHASNAVRMKLIKNGIYLFINSHWLGVGPGMYRYHHDTKQIPEDVGLQNGPHNWTVELLSQYGIVGMFYFILFLFMAFWALMTLQKNFQNSMRFLLTTLVFSIISNGPSAFLLLDINWIFTGIILLYFTNEILIRKPIENKSIQ